MKRFCQHHRGRLVLIVLTLFLVTGLPGANKGWSADASDFELKVYTANSQKQYQLDEPITLIMVLRNSNLLAISTKRGFELRPALIITDPNFPDGTAGITYKLQEPPDDEQRIEEQFHDMPRPFLWKRVTGWKEAQAFKMPLAETINDLRKEHPQILRKPGWHTITARLRLFLFDRAETHPARGLLGLDNTGDNWLTIPENQTDTIQIFISPGEGAQLQARVEDTESQPLAQVPVRVFKSSDYPAEYGLQQIWQNINPVLSGATDFGGQAGWTTGAGCQSRDAYRVIAYYKGEYQDAPGIANTDDGWGLECSGLIARTVTFAAAAAAAIDDLAARAKSGKVQLTWTHMGAASYNVYRGTISGGPYAFLASTTSTYATYLDEAVTNGVTYYYVVKPVSQNGVELSQSNEASATPTARVRRTR